MKRLLPLLSAFVIAALQMPPARAQAQVTATLDIPYASGADNLNKLDIYAPASAKDAPVLVWFHGGGREAGTRKDIQKLGREFAAEGILVVSPSYRLRTPATMNVDFRAQAADAAQALAWVEQNVAHYGGNPHKLIVAGVSAGAGLAALVFMDDHYLRAAGGDPKHIGGAFIMSGVLDNRPIPSDANAAMWRHDFGQTEAERWDVSPLKYVRGTTPPIEVSVAENENARFLTTRDSFVAQMRAAGAPISTNTVPGADHASEWIGVLNVTNPLHQTIVTFVKSHGA